MGSRYLISGVQLGMLKGFNNTGQKEELNTLLQEISNNQYCGYSDGPEVSSDASRVYFNKTFSD